MIVSMTCSAFTTGHSVLVTEQKWRKWYPTRPVSPRSSHDDDVI